MVHVHPLLRPLLLIPALALLSGCLSHITSITAPAEVGLEEPFVIAVDGNITGSGGGMVALVVQVPDGFVFEEASYICASARRPLRRNRRIQARFRAEEGHALIALADSIPMARSNTEEVRVFVTLRATKAGTFTLKFATGAVFDSGEQMVWKCTDPEDLRDFARLDEPGHAATITVIEPERNGTAAIAFSGGRDYVALPDSGVFRFDLASDFTIETWFNTTAREGAIISTRMDDFNGAFPIELAIDAMGSLVVSSSGGDSVVSTRSRNFYADGRWHHCSLAYTASTHVFELYVDALFVDQVTAPPRAGRTVAATLGCRPSKRYYFAGMLDEFRAWTDARTQEMAAYFRTIALSGYEQGLYAMYTFDKGEEGRIPNGTPVEGLEATAFNRPKLVPSTVPLKRELLSFSVVVAGEEVQMTWESFDETNVRSFEIEKRGEATKYARLASFEPQRTRERHQVYHATDVWSGKTLVHYRLRKQNTDGSVSFSEEVPVGSEVVLNFSLGVNNPEPFADKTVISFSLEDRTFVTLHIYDMMGRQVEELLAEKKAAGSYEVTFDGSQLPPGLYFYKMRTSTGAVTKKMYLSR